MAKRALSKEELEVLGMGPEEVKNALEMQKEPLNRRFKYIVRLTPAEAEQFSRETGKKFLRATAWGKEE